MTEISLDKLADNVRNRCIAMMARINQGHPGSVFSMIEILIALYYGNITSLNKPVKRNLRDKLIISKGHGTHSVYPILENCGFIPKGSCDLFGTKNHNLGPLRVFGNIKINGIDATTGSLGHGIGIGSGYALADKYKNNNRTYVIISEGEMYEGSIWEAALFASHHQLNNLTVIIDRNNKIILGDTENCLKLEPIDAKWEAFGWSVYQTDGHDIEKILLTLRQAITASTPQIIIANTIKGKGSAVMENRAEWHYWQSAEVHKLLLGEVFDVTEG